MLACMAASAGITIISNNQAVTSWKVNPTVLLAFLSSIWSSSITVVLTISITITWWRCASHGATLETLHCIWNKGFGLGRFSALCSSISAGRVAVSAWLVILVQIAHNPLLQHATRTVIAEAVVPDNITLAMSPQIPDGWMGTIYNASAGSMIGSRSSLSAIQDWWMNATITASSDTDSQCDGTCQGRVRSTGIAYNCSTTTMALDLLTPENHLATIFAINTTLSSNSTGAPILVLTTLHSSAVDSSCVATLTLRKCNIEAAVVEFPIIVQNSTVTIETDLLNPPVIVDKYVSEGDLLTAQRGDGAGPLQGLNGFVGDILTTKVELVINSTSHVAVHSGGFVGDIFFLANESSYDPSILHTCGLKWSDPTSYMLIAMQDFLFRASIGASTQGDSQTIPVQRTAVEQIFQSNYNNLAAALAMMLLALVAVSSQLWGWWELGRRVSFSPIEIANAFGTLWTRHDKESLTANEVLREVGQTEVKYDGRYFRGNYVILNGRHGDEPPRVGT